MSTPDRAWAATLALLGTHQLEEAVFSIEEWHDHVGGSGWTWIDHLSMRSPMASRQPGRRLATLGAQCLGGAVLFATTRRSATATRVVTTALCLGWGAAFVMHITVSVRTRSAMPGLATSIMPGLPGVVVVVRYIWS